MLNLLLFKTIFLLAPSEFNTIPFHYALQNHALVSDSIIQRTISKLNKINTIKYRQVFDQKLEKENRFNHVESDVYIEFLPTVEPIGFKFNVATRDYTTIYDGQKIYGSDTKTGKNWFTENPVKSNFSGQSFLYNSIPAIRSNLPVILRNDDIAKTISVIKKGGYYSIHFNMKKSVLNRLGGVQPIGDTRVTHYEIIIDTNTLLPVEIKQSDFKNKDFYVTTFSDISIDSDHSHLLKP